MNASVSKTKPSKKTQQPAAVPALSKKGEKDAGITVLESGSCPSLTGQSTLRYEVGRGEDAALYLRLVSNSGRGKFHRRPIALAPMMDALGSAKGPITSGTLRSVCRRMSANQGGFLLAVFAHKGLVQRLPNKLRGFSLGPAFQAGALAQPTAGSSGSAKPLRGKAVGKSSKK